MPSSTDGGHPGRTDSTGYRSPRTRHMRIGTDTASSRTDSGRGPPRAARRRAAPHSWSHRSATSPPRHRAQTRRAVLPPPGVPPADPSGAPPSDRLAVDIRYRLGLLPGMHLGVVSREEPPALGHTLASALALSRVSRPGSALCLRGLSLGRPWPCGCRSGLRTYLGESGLLCRGESCACHVL
jgi:hypothetical protein